jgi:methyl-accepting chemotaxis protein
MADDDYLDALVKEVSEDSQTEDTRQGVSDEGEKPDDQPDDGEKAEDDEKQPSTAEQPGYATKDDVAAALREYTQEQTDRSSLLKRASTEVIEKMYPDGIDKNIYDSNGNKIETAQDIIDRGLANPQSGELFDTYEEAASWLLNAQRTTNQNAEDLQNYADDVAEVNVDLNNGIQRIDAEWGQVLDSMPKVAEQIKNNYENTLVKDSKTGLVTKAPIDIKQFYDSALAPYMQLGEQMAKNEQLEKMQKDRQAVDDRDERIDMPSRGSSKTKANTGDEFVDALIDEINEE